MKVKHHSGKRTREQGSALLIAIFALLLISVVGLAMLVSTGTDTALALNYRNSTGGYYAAVAGLEEARGRLLAKNPNYVGDTNLAFVTSDIHNVLYLLNPINGETVNPLDLSSANPYADTEYGPEFPTWSLAGATVQTMASVSGTPGLPGPLYKWVRINLVSEQALNLNLDGSGINANPLYYTGAALSSSFSSLFPQALEITALAVMPDKSKRFVQYVVAQNSIGSQLTSNPFPPPTPAPIPNRDFPAALTLAGNNVVLQGPTSTSFFINGQDQGANCSSPNYMVASIGFTNSLDNSEANIEAGIPSPPPPPSSTDYRLNYLGYPPGSGSPAPPSPAPQSIQNVSTSMPTNWQTSAGLDAIVQNITANADVVINGNATGNDILARAPTMSPSNPMTIVINGNLDFNAWHQTGYGLLVVTGTLYYAPDATWEGVVLVIGQGNFVSTHSGTGGFDGAVFIAKTRDTSGALLPVLGAASFSQTGVGSSGRGINYNSCWINSRFVNGNWVSSGARGPLNYKILSFREITQ